MFVQLKRFMALIIACLALLALPAISQAQTYYSTTTGTLGDQNSSKEYRITATNDGVVHFASDTGILYPYTTASTNQTLTAAQTGTTFIFNDGAGVAASGTTFTLPSAVVGMQYTVVADVAKFFYIKPNSADTIKLGSATAGQRISNSATAAVGDSITVFCATAAVWSIKSKSGTWAVGPGQ